MLQLVNLLLLIELLIVEKEKYTITLYQFYIVTVIIYLSFRDNNNNNII